MKLTEEILLELGFEKKGKTFTRWMLDLSEDEPGIFSYNAGRIYFDVDTVEKLRDFWKLIDTENEYRLPINALSCYQNQFNDLPKWVKYIATDWNGDKNGYRYKPEIDGDQWLWDDDDNIDSEPCCVVIDSPGIVCLEWKESVIERQKA